MVTTVGVQVLKTIVEVIHAMLSDSLEGSTSLRFPVLSEYERNFFLDLNDHIVGMLLLGRREVALIVSELCHVRFLTFQFDQEWLPQHVVCVRDSIVQF